MELELELESLYSVIENFVFNCKSNKVRIHTVETNNLVINLAIKKAKELGCKVSKEYKVISPGLDKPKFFEELPREGTCIGYRLMLTKR